MNSVYGHYGRTSLSLLYITIHQNFAASTFGKIIKMGSGGVSSMAGRCFLRDQRLILWFLLTISTESKGQKQVINR